MRPPPAKALPSARRAGGRRFLAAGAVEDVDDAVIALVTRVFVQRSFNPQHLILAAPGAVPGRAVFDRELVTDGVRVGQREALNDLQVLRSASKGAPVLYVRRLDHEGVAFPLPARVALQLLD